MNEDAQLLKRFIDEHSEAAFRELVRQRIDFVYAAALRQVRGDVHLAQDVAQSVFLDLARKARVLAARSNLAGWLYTSTRYAAAKALRSRIRRLNHETEAHAMNEILAAGGTGETEWKELSPLIDGAMHELGEKDREALLLRFFEGRSHADVGAAIGLGENAARMRVDRALEKLRERLARRGVTSTAAALGIALAGQPIVAAPAGFAASAASVSLAGAAVSSSAWAAAAAYFFPLMSTAKLGLGVTAAIAAVGLGAFLGVKYQESQAATPESRVASTDTSAMAALREENSRLQAELARAASMPATAASKDMTTTASSVATPRGGSQTLENLRVLMDLRRRKIATPDMNLMKRSDGTLSQSFVELFGLTPTEQDSLQRAIEGARERLAALERENATVTRGPNGEAVIAIKPFPETGGAAYDAMLKTFAETLGPERHNAFLALGADQVERELKRFGTPQRTLTISRVDGGAVDAGYTLREDLKLPQENGNYSSQFRTFEELNRAIGGVAGLLPPDFAPRK